MNRIKMNTGRLNQDMQNMAGLLRGMQGELNNLRQSAAQLDSMWDGPSSEAFKKAFQDDMGALAEVLDNLKSIENYGENARGKYEFCERNVDGIVSAIQG